jgi:hypothetical protein
MSKDLDSEGQLILENFSTDERKELINSICDFISSARRVWEAEFETEHIDTYDADEEDPAVVEGMARVKAADAGLVWTQVNDTWHDLSQAIYPVENLGRVFLSGEMIVPGFQTEESGVRSEIAGYHLGKKTWVDGLSDSEFMKFMSKHVPEDETSSYASSTPYIWVWTEFDCPFCEQGIECTGDDDFTSGSIEHSGGSITFAN